MRELLAKEVKPTEAAKFSTHSLKATTLSWAAKAGLREGERRILGGHTKGKDSSMLIYSRDALAGPLASLAAVYTEIREGRFKPDLTRSGRWIEPLPAASSSSAATGEEGKAADEPDTGFLEESACHICNMPCSEFCAAVLCFRKVHASCATPCAACGGKFCSEEHLRSHRCAPEVEELEYESGAGSSSAVSAAASGAESETDGIAAELAAARARAGTAPPPLPVEGLWRRRKTGLFHRGPKHAGDGKSYCKNATLSRDTYVKLDAWPVASWPRCAMCFP